LRAGRVTPKTKERAMDMNFVSNLLEMFMLISFGFAWPTAVLKSLRSRTAKGKSIVFNYVILTGYSFGILSKLFSDKPIVWFVLVIYVVNLAMVSLDTALYYRNRLLDRGDPTPPLS
jgi:lipopolysaccharide export LptBFGC system permease protein LptF